MEPKKKDHKNNLRILFILDEPSVKEGGGAETFAFTLAKYLVQKGYPVIILSPRPKSNFNECQIKDGYKIHYLGIPLSKNHWTFALTYNVQLAIVLYKHSNLYDIIHVHGIRGLKIVCLLSKLFRKKSILTVVNQLHWESIYRKNIFQRLSNKFIDGFNKYISVNQNIKQILLSHNISPHKIFYIPNGIKRHEQIPCNQNPRSMIEIAPTTPLVLFVGRLHWQKDIPFLLTAWSILLKKIPHAKLMLLGEGPMRTEIDSLISKLHLNSSIECRGFVDNLLPYWLSADVFVLPSQIEGCSMALLEAMCLKLPCIVTDSPGNNEIIKHNINGLLVSFGNTEQLSQHMYELLCDKNLRNRLGSAAHDTVKKHFMIETIADQHLECYQQTVESWEKI